MRSRDGLPDYETGAATFFGTNVSTLKEYIQVVDERLGDVFIGTYVGPDKHTLVIYF